MNIEEKKATAPFSLRSAVWWYLLCSAAFLSLLAHDGGGCTPGGIVYCYGDWRDYWWHPTNVIIALGFVLLLPVPHILLALLFRSQRSLAAVFFIAKSWHKIVAVFIIILTVIGFLSSLQSGYVPTN